MDMQGKEDETKVSGFCTQMDGSAIICDRKNEKSTRFIREEPLVLKDDFLFFGRQNFEWQL